MLLKSKTVISGSKQLVRPHSSDHLPTSQSQVNIQMMSHTLTIREVRQKVNFQKLKVSSIHFAVVETWWLRLNWTLNSFPISLFLHTYKWVLVDISCNFLHFSFEIKKGSRAKSLLNPRYMRRNGKIESQNDISMLHLRCYRSSLLLTTGALNVNRIPSLKMPLIISLKYFLNFSLNAAITFLWFVKYFCEKTNQKGAASPDVRGVSLGVYPIQAMKSNCVDTDEVSLSS